MSSSWSSASSPELPCVGETWDHLPVPGEIFPLWASGGSFYPALPAHVAFGDRGEAPCVHVTHLMQERIGSLSEHIRGLEQMRCELERLVKKAKTLPGPDSGTFCHIIELARPSRSR